MIASGSAKSSEGSVRDVFRLDAAGVAALPAPARHRLTTVLPLAKVTRLSEAVSVERPRPLKLGRLGADFQRHDKQFPVREHAADHLTLSVAMQRESAENVVDVDVHEVHMTLWRTPSGRFLATVTLELRYQDLLDLIPVMGAARGNDLQFGGQSLTSWLRSQLRDVLAGGDELELDAERHQLLFVHHRDLDGAGDIDSGALDRLVHRTNRRHRETADSYLMPVDLMRTPSTLGAVGPAVSVLRGHEKALANSFVLSAVLLVDAQRRLRELKQEALGLEEALTLEADRELSGGGGQKVPARLVALQHAESRLSSLVLDLSRDVHNHLDVGLFVPGVRADAYHRALVSAMGMEQRVRSMDAQLGRAEAVVRTSSAALTTLMQRRNERRQNSLGSAIALLTLVAVPATLVLSYLGINTGDIDPDSSVSDLGDYPRAYAFGIALFLASALIAGME